MSTVPYGFKAANMAATLKKAGIDYETTGIVDDPRKANQLYRYVIHNEQRLKVSFAADAYFEAFPAVERPFGGLIVRTEDIPGLYRCTPKLAPHPCSRICGSRQKMSRNCRRSRKGDFLAKETDQDETFGAN